MSKSTVSCHCDKFIKQKSEISELRQLILELKGEIELLKNASQIQSSKLPAEEIINEIAECQRRSRNVTMYNLNESSQKNARDWGKYTPAMLRQPKSPTLAVKARKTHKPDEAIVNRVRQWTEMKVLLEESRKEFLKQEQELKLRCYKEKHDEEVRLTRSKAELQEALPKEKHKIEVEILNIQKENLLKSKKF
ncbi:hypothetical protein FQR65_LT15475 [Abscondita terminalis]|nr:hypothetical protein FQR65_LT15474 [Abscondita terminalis]KAF5278930.1 hypothetical protein FQR65_LT15475 [Abscondita terminalis]